MIGGLFNLLANADANGSSISDMLLTALIATICSIIVNYIFSICLPSSRRKRLTKIITIIVDPPHHIGARFCVINNGFWTMHQAMVYIKLDYEKEDIIRPISGQKAFITPENPTLMTNFQQLCWSVCIPGNINPMKIDIYSNEQQPLSPCQITDNEIVIGSEQGWENGARRRVYLKRKKYSGMIRVVSDDTTGKDFHIIIDPDSNGWLMITPA